MVVFRGIGLNCKKLTSNWGAILGKKHEEATAV